MQVGMCVHLHVYLEVLGFVYVLHMHQCKCLSAHMQGGGYVGVSAVNIAGDQQANIWPGNMKNRWTLWSQAPLACVGRSHDSLVLLSVVT